MKRMNLMRTKSEQDVLQFWSEKQYTDKELYAISTVCFAVPPTQVCTKSTLKSSFRFTSFCLSQVTIERAFSTLRLVLTDYRNRLNQDMLEDILLVKLNPNFLNSAIETLPLFEDDDDVQ